MGNHLIDSFIIKKVLHPLDPNSHKGQNGKILIVGSSPLFHGAGILSAQASFETLVALASKTNDMVYFCSTKENLEYLKKRQEVFIGIRREQLDDYLPNVDVVLIGPGLMREMDPKMPDTENEPNETLELTQKVLNSDKKIVMDAGSLQIVSREQLKGKEKVIITPHRKEMARLFDLDLEKLMISYQSEFSKIEELALLVQQKAKELNITILLKGPIDIIADSDNWAYSKRGNVGMTKGGSGDVLAGIVAAFYTKNNSAFLVACLGSFLNKKVGDMLYKKNYWLYNSSDLVKGINEVLSSEIKSNLGEKFNETKD